jgi:hypothetical protein
LTVAVDSGLKYLAGDLYAETQSSSPREQTDGRSI